MLMTFDIQRPKAPPNRVEAVVYDTLFPDISPMLLFFDNCIFILALEAEANKKQIFFPTFAKDANKRKCYGKLNVNISTYIEIFNAKIAINLHFLMSSSKFLPYLDANKIPPSYPKPSFNTQV